MHYFVPRNSRFVLCASVWMALTGCRSSLGPFPAARLQRTVVFDDYTRTGFTAFWHYRQQGDEVRHGLYLESRPRQGALREYGVRGAYKHGEKNGLWSVDYESGRTGRTRDETLYDRGTVLHRRLTTEKFGVVCDCAYRRGMPYEGYEAPFLTEDLSYSEPRLTLRVYLRGVPAGYKHVDATGMLSSPPYVPPLRYRDVIPLTTERRRRNADELPNTEGLVPFGRDYGLQPSADGAFCSLIVLDSTEVRFRDPVVVGAILRCAYSPDRRTLYGETGIPVSLGGEEGSALDWFIFSRGQAERFESVDAWSTSLLQMGLSPSSLVPVSELFD